MWKTRNRVARLHLHPPVRESVTYLLENLATAFKGDDLRFRIPAIFGERGYCEIVWWPSTSILIYEGSIRCFDGKVPRPSVVVTPTEHIRSVNTPDNVRDVYRFLRTQSDACNISVLYDEDTDDEESI